MKKALDEEDFEDAIKKQVDFAHSEGENHTDAPARTGRNRQYV
jgi:hypothetical protein